MLKNRTNKEFFDKMKQDLLALSAEDVHEIFNGNIGLNVIRKMMQDGTIPSSYAKNRYVTFYPIVKQFQERMLTEPITTPYFNSFPTTLKAVL